jgi:hypothetical protein
MRLFSTKELNRPLAVGRRACNLPTNHATAISDGSSHSP